MPASRALYTNALRYLYRRPWQTILMVIGITLGVAVVIAVDVANESASLAFDLSTDAVAGRATHQIIAGSQGVPASLYVDLRLGGLAFPAAPVLAEFVASPQLGGVPLQLLGIDLFAEAPFRSYFGGEGGAPGGLSSFLTRPGGILISRPLAERYGLGNCPAPRPEPVEGQMPSSNCQVDLEINGFTRPAVIVGLLDPADALSQRALDGLILADIATAQELTGQLGKLSHIDLIIPEGADTAPLEARLPEGVHLIPMAARTGTIEQMTSAFRLNLTALSLLALIVGLFLIYNTMTFSVVKRRPLFGTLRCLGVSRREVFALVAGEALIIGVLGSALGVLLGIVLGQGAVRLVTQTINDLYFVVTVRGVQVPPASLVKGFALGVLATVGAAAFPAAEAASVPPRAALSRSGLEAKAKGAVRLAALAGLGCILAGGLLLLPNTLAISFVGTLLIMVGFAALTPAATRVLMAVAGRISGRWGGLLSRMAPRNVSSALSRTSVAVAALMVAVSVTIGISLMVGSFRATVVAWLEQTLQGDVYISPPDVSGAQPGGEVASAVLEALANRPDIAQLDLIRIADVNSNYGAIRIGATTNPTSDGQRPFAEAIGSPEQVDQAIRAGGIILSEPLARRLGVPFTGGTITLETPQGPREFSVAGVYYDYGNTTGIGLIDLELYRALWADPAVTAISLQLTGGADPDEVAASLREQLAPIQQLQISPNKVLRDSALVVFDRTFAITSALQGLTTIVAFIGVLSALLSLQLDKARELGVLRAIGLTGRQLFQLVLMETGLMGGVAGLLAMPTGFVLSLILIYIINRRAFGWTLQLHMQAAPFVQALVVAVLAALLAGVYPAIKMGRMPAAEVLRGE